MIGTAPSQCVRAILPWKYGVQVNDGESGGAKTGFGYGHVSDGDCWVLKKEGETAK